jgi:hypothetical protein
MCRRDKREYINELIREEEEDAGRGRKVWYTLSPRSVQNS